MSGFLSISGRLLTVSAKISYKFKGPNVPQKVVSDIDGTEDLGCCGIHFRSRKRNIEDLWRGSLFSEDCDDIN